MRLRLKWIGAVLAVVLAVGAGVVWQQHHRGAGYEPGQGLRIASPDTGRSAAFVPSPATTPADFGHAFVTSISANRRYFLDQRGRPILVRGDSPWALPVDLTPAQADLYFAARASQGFNAAIVSLLGSSDNGAYHADGTTVDGIAPFVGGDVTDLNAAYWQRIRAMVTDAAKHGITVFAYPVDGWTIGATFTPATEAQCMDYGRAVGQWLAGLPNLVWVTGGDYFPVTNDKAAGSDVDHCFSQVHAGLTAAGAKQPFSIQLGYDKSESSDNPYWRPRVTWNFVYTYHPTYRAVLDARGAATMPAILGEANYEGENNQGATPPTTNQTLRRQVLWALTSGAGGDFFGTSDWKFDPGWQTRLASAGARQVNLDRTLVARLDWTHLVPTKALVVSGAGTYLTTDRALDVLQNNYATAARTASGTQAVVYVPTGRTLHLNMRLLATGVRGTWIDPVNGATRTAGRGPTFTTPGKNSGGDADWLLVLR